MEKVKKILNSIWNEFVYGGHLLSLGGTGIMASVLILLDKKIDWQILIIAYLIPQIIYTYNHFREAKIDLTTNPERVKHLLKFIKYFPLIFLFYIFVLFLILILFANFNTFLFVTFLIIGGVLFTEYFKGLTKKIIGFKNFYVSFFWAGGIFLPIFYYSLSFNLFFFLFFLFVFLRLLIDTIFFDIKDIKTDNQRGLKTLPIIIGKNTTLKYLNLLNFLSFSPLAIGIYLKLFPIFSLFLILIYFYTFYYLKQAATILDSKKLRTLSYLMVDGGYIFWPLFLALGKILLKQF